MVAVVPRSAPPSDFVAFYAAEFAAVGRSVARIVGDEAEDVAQEALAIAARDWDRVRELDAPGAWVRLVARRIALRRRSRDLMRADRAPRSQPEGADLEVALAALDVARALNGLEEADRRAVWLHHVAELPVDAVAAMLGSTTGATKVRLLRARARLALVLAGASGRWRSDQSWATDAVVAGLRAAGDGMYADAVLASIPDQTSSWAIELRRDAYRIVTDAGVPLDWGRQRPFRDGLVLLPWNNSGRVVLDLEVVGRRARFRLVSDTSAPTDGVPDDVYIRLLLASGAFVREPTPPHVGDRL